MKKYAFQNLTLPACVKTDLVLILCVINFSCFSSQWFCVLEKVQVNIQGVEHDLWWIARIEQIDSRLYKCIIIIILLDFLQGCRELLNKNIRVP